MEAALEAATRQDISAAAQLQAFSLLVKIVSNVLEPPTSNAEEAGKYRCLNSSSNALQQRVLRHGPAYENLLFALGFVRTVEPPPPRAAALLQQHVEQQQQQTEQQQQQDEKSQQQEQTESKKQRAEEEQAPQKLEQQLQTQPEQREGGQPYYYYLPEDVDLNVLLEALQLLRATTESLKLAGAGSCISEKQLAAAGDAAAAGARDPASGGATKPAFGASASLHATAVDGVKLPLTTSRAIREQAHSAHAKNQAALRQLREEQRERFEHRAETTRGSKAAAALTPVASVGSKDTNYSKRGSRSRGKVDSGGSRFDKKGSPQAATDTADDFTEAAPAAPGAANAAAGVGRKKSQKSSSSLQAAGRFFRKLCKGKSFGSLGKQRGGAAAT